MKNLNVLKNLDCNLGDGHCWVHCFTKRFNKATELVLERLWHEMNENIELYIRFGVYESLSR